jgi:YD repeat-containing protein
MDVTNLILYLKSKITDKTIDQQMVSKAIKLLELGAVFTADSFAALPVASANAGQLYYVTFDGLYWSTGEYWFPIVSTSVNTAWTWGCNNFGTLGDNTTTSKSSPVSVVGGFGDWRQLSAGASHSLGVRRSGTAWAWGFNGNFSWTLGDNTNTNRSSPVSVVGGFSDWCQVGAGTSHSLGVRTGGSAWAWGFNDYGRLGDNTTTNKSSPVSVVGGFSDWCQLSGGQSHSLGVRTGGSAWAWGRANGGQLGNNSINDASSPVSVVGGFSDWCQISAGGNHSLGVRTGGSAWAWGVNGCGQMGNNTTTLRSSPVSVVGGFSDWCQISGGYTHSLGVRTGGSAWAWGYNAQGRLGNNTTANRSSPVSVVGGFSDWCQISAGSHSAGVRTVGSAWAWGYNNTGQLGQNTTVNRSSPVSVVGGFSDWFQVASSSRNPGAGSFSLGLRNRTT